ncbi:MAG: hypothetical protein JXC35_01345 [Acholeplasmataceae bacterium]|nr:hypothetical protein [Acholeplasmataceae bacterium]
MIKKKLVLGYVLLTILSLILFALFLPTTLLQEPKITPVEFLSGILYWTIYIGNRSLIIIYPSETLIVFFLGIEILLLGWSFLKKRDHEPSFWWGISMIFWGIGTLLAGTSYQGLGYELKCNGEPFCLFTSWFELSYLYFTALSISALAIAFAKSVLPKDKQSLLVKYGFVSSICYTLILITGTILEMRFLISYELFTIFFMPLFLIFFIYNIIYYKKHRDHLNRSLMITWLLFLVVNVSYYVYYFLGFTDWLYQNYHIWFSANDVLHVTLIIWMAFIWIKIKPQIHQI